MSNKISQQEIIDLFGEMIPIEVAIMLHEADASVSPDEMRAKLRQVARELAFKADELKTVEPLYGPQANICWTQDNTPKEHRKIVQLMPKDDYVVRSQAEAIIEKHRLHFEGEMDKWMKLAGTGITGYQPEAYAVMDEICRAYASRPSIPADFEAIIREYVEARDAYEDATKPSGRFGAPKILQHSNPIVARFCKARDALRKAA